jgi:hypothetical protein
LKNIKKLFKYIGIGIFIVGGICLLLTIIQVIGLIGSFNIFGGDNAISNIVNLVAISIFCFVLGWIFVDFFQ